MEIQPILQPWRKVKRWTCIKCGKCCEVLDVPVTPIEEKRLKKYGDVFRQEKIGLYLKKNGHCIFYDGECRIYEDRPIACLKYPFYIRYEGSEEALFEFGEERYYIYLDVGCSGVGLGFRLEGVLKKLIGELKKRKILVLLHLPWKLKRAGIYPHPCSYK